MTVTIEPELQAALVASARERGVTAEAVALTALRERFLPPPPLVPQDEWERRLFAAAIDCGVSLSDEALSRGHVRLMTILLDTNILVRLANRSDASHATAERAVAELHRRGEMLYVTAQNFIEFWAVATRPKGANGLGLSTMETLSQLVVFNSTFMFVAEPPTIYPAWFSLVSSLGVIGKQVHDARFVAVCHVHGITHVLTFNVSHFTRYVGFGPGVIVLDPKKI